MDRAIDYPGRLSACSTLVERWTLSRRTKLDLRPTEGHRELSTVPDTRTSQWIILPQRAPGYVWAGLVQIAPVADCVELQREQSHTWAAGSVSAPHNKKPGTRPGHDLPKGGFAPPSIFANIVSHQASKAFLTIYSKTCSNIGVSL